MWSVRGLTEPWVARYGMPRFHRTQFENPCPGHSSLSAASSGPCAYVTLCSKQYQVWHKRRKKCWFYICQPSEVWSFHNQFIGWEGFKYRNTFLLHSTSICLRVIYNISPKASFPQKWLPPTNCFSLRVALQKRQCSLAASTCSKGLWHSTNRSTRKLEHSLTVRLLPWHGSKWTTIPWPK